jgi:cell fate (sporulation/competence/biofilm development) regulator YmcA (YheA/YmcA/DUF963 family)
MYSWQEGKKQRRSLSVSHSLLQRKRMKPRAWQKTQATVQKLYKEIPEVPLVVEATMEEQVQMIGEVIKGF